MAKLTPKETAMLKGLYAMRGKRPLTPREVAKLRELEQKRRKK